MAEKVSIWAEDCYPPFGHFAQAIKFGNQVFISGMLPLDPKTGRPIESKDMKDQAKMVLDNLTAVMQAAGGQISNIMMTTVYLLDMREYKTFDEISKEVFFFLPPARTTVMVSGLPGNSRICIDAQAILNPVETKGTMI